MRARVTALSVAVVSLALAGAARAGPAAPVGLDGEIKSLTYVGFHARRGGARVYLRTTDAVRYEIDRSHAGLVVLTLNNVRVPVANNARPLPTEHFVSPVLGVAVRPIEDASPSVRVEVRTRGRSACRVTQEDTLLALDFPAGE